MGFNCCFEIGGLCTACMISDCWTYYPFESSVLTCCSMLAVALDLDRRQHLQRWTGDGHWGQGDDGAAGTVVRQRKADPWWPPDDPAQLGRQAAVRHHLPLQRLGQAVLPGPHQVSDVHRLDFESYVRGHSKGGGGGVVWGKGLTSYMHVQMCVHAYVHAPLKA